MDQYFQQFKNLPRELKQSVSSEEKVIALEEIEKKYNLRLIKLVVRIMIKNISWLEVEKFCQENFNLAVEKARALKKELADKIFNEVMNYLQKAEGEEKSKEPAHDQEQEFKKQQIEIGDMKKEKLLVVEKQILNPPPLKPIAKKDFFQPIKLEIDRHKIKEDFNRIKPTLNQNFSQDDFIKKIINQLNLSFESDDLIKRFSNIIKNYLRDIRTEAQTEELLQTPQKTNGLEMTGEQAVLVVKMAQEFKKQKTLSSKKYFVERESKKEDLTEKPKPQIQDPNQSHISDETESKNIKIEEPVVNYEIKKRFENGAINPFFQKINKPLAIKSPKVFSQIVNKVSESSNKKIIEEGFSIPIKKPLSNNNLVQDVSISRFRALGPVEELAEITLADLQHWGGGVNTTKIVFDKINLLGEISLIKKTEAIHAWQKSPLYLLYLELGRLALGNSQSILQIINGRQQKKLPTMTIEDFEAISELNKRLRF